MDYVLVAGVVGIVVMLLALLAVMGQLFIYMIRRIEV